MSDPTPRVGRPSRRARAVTDRVMRYQLIVIAPSGADVVQFAGGWLFDRRMAGWDIDVLVPDQDAARSLRVLGVRAVDLHAGLASVVRGPERAAGLAVAADLMAIDERIHEEVLEAVRSGITEVALWGGTRPAKIGGRVEAPARKGDMDRRLTLGQELDGLGSALRSTACQPHPPGVGERSALLWFVLR